jgi:histidine triad (HIT) family protein
MEPHEKDCLFCRMARGEIPTEMVAENERFIAIKDKYPKAPVHVLVIPRKHIEWLNDIGGQDAGFCKEMLEFIVVVAGKLGVRDSGYRVITNVGSGGGQIIFHLHWHILAKAPVGFDIEGGP